GGGHAVALSSGTAGIHLGLILAGAKAGDEVICPSLTFIGSSNPILYIGAKPIFIDSDRESWNLDPQLLAEFLKRRADENRVPKFLILVHLYGQPADLDAIVELCERYEITLIEDAAEALGTRYKGRALGLDGQTGIYSFNGNKIITTSGGGMLVSRDPERIERARFLSTQARDPAPYYQHSEMGFNYRMSNVLAAIGLGQMEALGGFVTRTKAIFARYSAAFADVDAISMMPVPDWADTTHWLSCLTINPVRTSVTPEDVRLKLDSMNIEARPLWKPMHLQPHFADAEMIGGEVSETLFKTGLCLPSGPNLRDDQVDRIAGAIREALL
ncbi:MAG: dTDP-4-amino-4,6-dideoxygalactose transaminase, partial [Verrucomicrobiales bacterium]